MERVLRIVTVCLLSLFFIASGAPAEEKENEAVKLEEIVVTATRTEKDAAEAPGSISVVTKKDIEKRNVRTIDQALNGLPGVFNGRSTPMDSSQSISLRGMPHGKGRTLVMVDGISLVDPMWGFLGLSGLAPEDVKRIEVVKGPFSSLYGGNAMGGVVNIIQKMPEKREITLKTGYGSSWDREEAADDLRKLYISYGDKFMDKLSLFLSYGTEKTEGYPEMLNVQRTQPTAGITGWSYTTDRQGNLRYLIGDKGATEWWDENITLKSAYDFSETSKINLSYKRNRYEREHDDPHTYLRDASGNSVWSYGTVKESSFLDPATDLTDREQNLYSMSYETQIATVKSKLSFSYIDVIFKGPFPGTNATYSGGPGTDWEHSSDQYNTELLFTAPLFERHLLTFGGSFRQNIGQSDEHNRTNWRYEGSRTSLTYRAKGKDRTYSLFAQDEIMIHDKLTAYVGFREDWWETYDGSVFQLGAAGYPKNYDSSSKASFNPKVSLVYNPFEATILKVSAGKAFRSPTISELYRTYTYTLTGITNAGNPDLKPETTKSWDIGAEQQLWKGAKIKAAYFENYMKDFIYSVIITPTLNENQNVGKAESKGVELEAEQSFGNWLRLFTNYTYTDSKIKENSAKPEIEGKRLTMIPKTIFNIGADLAKGPFSASLVGRYVSKVYRNDNNSDKTDNVFETYDPYFVADAKVSYKIAKFTTLSVSVDNLFDEDYFYSNKAPGRSWFSELTFNF